MEFMSDKVLAEMKQLRRECRELNSEILVLSTQKSRRDTKFQTLRSENTSNDQQLESLTEKVQSFNVCNVSDLETQVVVLEQEIGRMAAQYDQLLGDTDRLTKALKVQKQSRQKEMIYNQVHGRPRQTTAREKADNCGIALRRALEDELEDMKGSNFPLRLLAHKRAQVTRANVLCP